MMLSLFMRFTLFITLVCLLCTVSGSYYWVAQTFQNSYNFQGLKQLHYGCTIFSVGQLHLQLPFQFLLRFCTVLRALLSSVRYMNGPCSHLCRSACFCHKLTSTQILKCTDFFRVQGALKLGYLFSGYRSVTIKKTILNTYYI